MSETLPDVLATSPFEDAADTRALTPKRPSRLRRYLLIGLVFVVGFVGGAQVQKHFGTSGSGSGNGGVSRTFPSGGFPTTRSTSGGSNRNGYGPPGGGSEGYPGGSG
jgi:hypothetical protein